MPTAPSSASKLLGIILYGLVAGFAATVVMVFGSVFLGFFASWIFNFLGWRKAAISAEMSGFYCIYFTGAFGLLAGVIVCLYVWITRLRNPPTP